MKTRLELPRRLLGGSAVVMALALLAALVVGSWRAEAEVAEEMQAAMDLAVVLQHAHRLAGAAAAADDGQALEQLRGAVGERRLRHLALTLRDDGGRQLWALRPSEPPSGVLQVLVDLHRRWQWNKDPAPLYLPLLRPDGAEWSLVVSPSPDSERRQALTVMLRLLLVLAVGSVLLLGVMRWQIHRLLRPMGTVLDTIDRMRRGQWLAPGVAQPVRLAELQAVQDALKDLGRALQDAEGHRQLLAQRLLTLQEDERRHMARELHDELGQRLTALRLDATVLHRKLGANADPSHQALAADLELQVRHAQQEVRELMSRLAPRMDEHEAASRLSDLLQALAVPREGVAVDVQCEPGMQALPSALVLAAYRMTQEAITNALRHAHARRIEVRVVREGNRLQWHCRDDGVGLGDLQAAFLRGNGLAGMRQRAWVFGGDLHVMDAHPGLQLQAILYIDPHGGSPSPHPAGQQAP